MNETNSLEARLKSWAPRRPSATLETALFGRPARRESRQHFAFGWLAPAAACLFLTVSMLHHPEGDILQGADGPNVIASQVASNQSYAPYLPAGYQNTIHTPNTFDWTNRGSSSSSNHPIFPGITGGPERF
jgi:hypothetical protein